MIEVDPKDWQIKKLKNRWGSVTKNKKIVLNVNLIKTPKNIIDYIIIQILYVCTCASTKLCKTFFALLPSRKNPGGYSPER